MGIDVYTEWMKSTKPFDWKDVDNFLAEESTLNALITAHSHIEIVIRMALTALAGNLKNTKPSSFTQPNIKKIKDYKVCTLIELSNFFGIIEDQLYSDLKNFNSVRNKWVHGYLFRDQLNEEEAKRLAKESEKYIPRIVTQLGNLLTSINGNKSHSVT
ncbi:hypothetical protein COV12_00445 [Candidatus Woesearchaeota archaeon CG10_big_fil_rev_8_21_14_0_10_32_24]|nr:MAG: hypothetical protein COV12_00445 [Candidatus Woesearchaeota archaeon CG10_big_fil_rev_8_21_14_0_10_32_24]